MVGAKSTAICRVSASTAPLDAAYAASSRTPTIAATEATFTTAPPPHRWIAGIAARDMQNTPLTLTDIVRSQSASFVSTTLLADGRSTPALFTQVCRPPKCSTAAATINSASATTSPSIALANPSAVTASAAVRSAASPSRSATSTAAPFRAKSSEIALPMPDPPPVTTATLPARAAPATPTEAAYNERSFVNVPSRGSACERSLFSVSGSDVVIWGVAPRVAAAPLVVSIVIILPITLLGALFVEIGPEFGLERAELGLLVAVVLGVSILVAPAAGILSERRGASRALALSAVLAAAACAGIASVARSGVGLVPWLVAAGLANAIGQPATTIFVAQTIPASRQGFAFGVKQATAPLGTLLAGIAVPAFALTVGWRWAFATTAALAVRGGVRRPTARQISAPGFTGIGPARIASSKHDPLADPGHHARRRRGVGPRSVLRRRDGRRGSLTGNGRMAASTR